MGALALARGHTAGRRILLVGKSTGIRCPFLSGHFLVLISILIESFWSERIRTSISLIERDWAWTRDARALSRASYTWLDPIIVIGVEIRSLFSAITGRFPIPMGFPPPPSVSSPRRPRSWFACYFQLFSCCRVIISRAQCHAISVRWMASLICLMMLSAIVWMNLMKWQLPCIFLATMPALIAFISWPTLVFSLLNFTMMRIMRLNFGIIS